MALDQALFLNLADEIQYLLRAPYSKGRYDHVAAAVERPLDDLCKNLDVRTRLVMISVAVGGLDNDIVRPFDGLRISDYRLIRVAYIAAEQHFSRNAVFGEPYLYACGA